MDDFKKAQTEMDALRKAEKKTEQKEGHKILKALQKENALKKAGEKTQQKEGHKILKEDAFRKAEGKRIAALIKAQEEEKNQRIQLMKLSIQSITNYLLMDILKILRRDLESTLHRYSRALA